MAGGPTISVRQVASYPAAAPLAPGDLLLLQAGGMGGPYATVTAATLVSSALVGTSIPLQAPSIDTSEINLPSGAPLAWGSTTLTYGLPTGLSFTVGPSTTPALTLSPAGDLRLPLGSLTVARDPGSAFDVVTLGFMGRSTVASFNSRRGVVTLQASDIYGALGICPPDTIATACSVDAAICAAIQDFIRTYPSVWSWMGRVGDVFLTVADINWAIANNPPGAPPVQVPTPPPTANDSEAVNAEWVINYVASVLAGPPAYATQDWVLQQLALINVGVTSFNGRSGLVTLALADVLGAGGAPIASPNFTGIPAGPTAPPGTSSSQLATTAFVVETLEALSPGVVSFNGRSGTVTLSATDINDAGGALLTSPNFLGTPTAPTPPAGDGSQRIATTAFVEAAVAAATAGVASFNGRTGIVTLTLSDVEAVGGAPVASPNFSGVPTAPTAPNGTSTTQLATTAFVLNELQAISAGVVSFNGRAGIVTFTQNDLSAVGGLYNPSAALTGTPTAPTQAPGDNSTRIATTAFVVAAIQGAAVTSFNGRSGAVTLTLGDVTTVGGAPISSPSFNGLPTAPTPAPGNSSTLLATTAFVQNALGSYLPLGGGTLTGPLSLAGNATQPLNAVPLQQLNTALGAYLPLAGGTVTGPTYFSTIGNFTTPAVGLTGTATSLQMSGVWFSATANALGIQAVSGGAATQLATITLSATSTITNNLTLNGQLGVANNATFNSQIFVTGTSNLGATSVGALLSANGGINTTNINTTTISATSSGSFGNGGTVIGNRGIAYSWVAGNQISFQWSNTIPGYNTYVDGTFVGPLVLNTSDPRLKTAVGPVEADALNVISQVSLQSFDLNPPHIAGDAPQPTHYRIGFMADTLAALIPEGVIKASGPGQYDSLNLMPLLAYAFSAIQQLLQRITALEGAHA